MRVNEFEFVSLLGAGSYGEVVLARREGTKELMVGQLRVKARLSPQPNSVPLFAGDEMLQQAAPIETAQYPARGTANHSHHGPG
jgi:hypothetical protein